MEKKTSSVEWLVEQYEDPKNIHSFTREDWLRVIKQAKEMHREEIEEAYKKGFEDVNAEQYYNETFKQYE